MALTVPSPPSNRSGFSPDGASIVTSSDDGTARLWRRLEPVAEDVLWSATHWCLPAPRLVDLLGVDDDDAAAEEELCRSRVAK